MSAVFKTTPNRREMLFYFLLAAAVLLGIIAILIGGWYLTGDSGDLSQAVTPGRLADFPISDRPVRWHEPTTGTVIWLVRSTEGMTVFSGRTPNDYWVNQAGQACLFAWNETTELFIDPCSGDHFNLQGELVRVSPGAGERAAQRDLDRYAVDIGRDGQLWIYLDRLLPGSAAAAE